MANQPKYSTRARTETPINTAKRLFDANKRDKARTVTQLVNLAEHQKSLRDDLLRRGAMSLVGDIVASDRYRAISGDDAVVARPKFGPNKIVPPTHSRAQGDALRKIRFRSSIRRLLEFPLPTPGNKLLRNSNSAEIGEAVQFYARQSGDMAHKAKWLAAVQLKLPKGKTVDEVLDERTLQRLYDSVAA